MRIEKLSYFLTTPVCLLIFFFFQAEDGIRDKLVTGVQTCALPIYAPEQQVDAPLEARIARRYRLQLRPALRVHPRRAGGAGLDAGRGLKRAQRPGARGAIARDAGRSLCHG